MSLAVLVFLVVCYVSFAEENQSCPAAIHCGMQGDIRFPFTTVEHPECGLLIIENCNSGIAEKTSIRFGKDSPRFYLYRIMQDDVIAIGDTKYPTESGNSSCQLFRNLSLPSSPFYSLGLSSDLTLIKCPPTPTQTPPHSLLNCNDSTQSLLYTSLRTPPSGCSVIQPLINKTQNHVFFYNTYAPVFVLQVSVTKECRDCNKGGGQCRIDTHERFYCSTSTIQQGHGKSHILLLIVVAVAAGGICTLIILTLCWLKRSPLNKRMVSIWNKKCKKYHDIEVFLEKYGSIGPKRYSYSDVKRMTDSFKYKLGEGGYGRVYKGKLIDSRDVAVKVLYGLKGNGEDFINEVASISWTSHKNIVGLFGYCCEDNKRALIYEYVSNGSLEKYIFKNQSTYKSLEWEELYQIALGIARGLEYLHCGCSTRIVHFDIKPHNILLNDDLCPKISDFGLAKLCLEKESIISMTGARGTIGYIAPEVFCRQFGEVSHKSDVYSYGMMILEMVGGRKNLDCKVSKISEIYFPHWIYERLEANEELGLHGIECEEENNYARKMVIVSLWCIQTNPSLRPTMSKVLELLEGSLELLEFPPKPFLSSPRSEVIESSLEDVL